MICIDGNEKYEIVIYFTTFLLYGQTGEIISYFRWKIHFSFNLYRFTLFLIKYNTEEYHEN